jgi:hypothetical protein
MRRFKKYFQGLFSENIFLVSPGKEDSVGHRSNKVAAMRIQGIDHKKVLAESTLLQRNSELFSVTNLEKIAHFARTHRRKMNMFFKILTKRFQYRRGYPYPKKTCNQTLIKKKRIWTFIGF